MFQFIFQKWKLISILRGTTRAHLYLNPVEFSLRLFLLLLLIILVIWLEVKLLHDEIVIFNVLELPFILSLVSINRCFLNHILQFHIHLKEFLEGILFFCWSEVPLLEEAVLNPELKTVQYDRDNYNYYQQLWGRWVVETLKNQIGELLKLCLQEKLQNVEQKFRKTDDEDPDEELPTPNLEINLDYWSQQRSRPRPRLLLKIINLLSSYLVFIVVLQVNCLLFRRDNSHIVSALKTILAVPLEKSFYDTKEL